MLSSVLPFLLACGSPSADPASPPAAPTAARLAFAPLAAPSDDAEGNALRWAPSWTLGDATGPLRPQILVTEGEPVGGRTFGTVTDAAGRDMVELGSDGLPRPAPWVSGSTDFAALLDLGSRLVLFNHVEERSGGLWVTDLDLAADGTLAATATTALDLSAVRGTKDPCAGDVTPWGTVISGEEYEPDATRIGPDGRFLPPLCPYDASWHDQARALPPGTASWPYDYGWILETDLRPEEPRVRKRPALGRFSHELGVVLPDERTVYLTDDVDAGGGLFLFVADHPRTLASGRLYALRWKATRADGSGEVAWVPLGHVHEDALDATLRARALDRDDLLDVDPPAADGSCPSPQQRVIDTYENRLCGAEGSCVAVQPGMDALATRLETRRSAALRGATVEWSKSEGLAFDPDHDGGRVWLAVTAIAGTMADARGDLQREANPCGSVWAFEGLRSGVVDTAGDRIDSPWVATTLREVVVGRPTGQPGDQACAVDAIANPDNVAYLPGHRLLVIAEDTGRHRFPTLWAYDTEAGTLGRLATGPRCSEWTGLHWFPDVRGSSWLTVSMQHAYAYKDCVVPEAERPEGWKGTWSGVVGPWPVAAP